MRAAAVDAPDSAWPTRGTLELRDVRLRYTSGGPLVLRGVSLAANAGERVGIVGRTGAGKSSLLLAIFRMAPVEGQACLSAPPLLPLYARVASPYHLPRSRLRCSSTG